MAYVTRLGNQFVYNGSRFRFIGGNYYPLCYTTAAWTGSALDTFFQGAIADGVRVIRTWIYNNGSPSSNNLGNFRYLTYPTGSNIVSNGDFETDTSGWTLGADFTRSNQDAESGSWSIKQVSTSGFVGLSTQVTVTANTNYVWTFWYKMSNPSGFAPVAFVGTTAGSNNVKDGGFNSDTGGIWKQKQVLFNSGSNTSLFLSLINFGGTATGFYDNINLSTQQTPTLTYYEPTFQNVDLVLDRARAAGVKLTLVFADWNDAAGDRQNYCRWSDSIYGTTYIAGVTQSVSSLVGNGTTATCTTGSAHGFNSGDLITIAGDSLVGLNGTNVYITKTGSTTFTYNSSAIGAGTGTITATRGTNAYQAFYTDSNIQQMYKDYMLYWTSRTNTINGQTYGSDDTIFSWELGNEMRFDQNNDPGINGSSSKNLALLGATGGWIDIMSTYLKSIDANHLIGATDLSHTTDFVSGDTIHNGTFYGLDFTTTGSLTNVDYFDVHMYPFKNGNTMQQYGQAYGYPASPTMQGLRTQMDAFCRIAHTNNKPMIVGEWGVDKIITGTGATVAYPRANHFQKVMDDFFGSGGDGFVIWHYYGQNSYPGDGNYGVQSQGVYPSGTVNGFNYSTLPSGNQTDMQLISYFRAKDAVFQGKRVRRDVISNGIPFGTI